MKGTDKPSTGRASREEPSFDEAMHRAKRLEWITIIWQAITVVLVAIVAGQSQAMKAAWIEDCLSFLPPLAFLVAARRIRKRADLNHPYGYHRSVGIGHLVGAVALFTMGAYLIVDSVLKLVTAERAPIGLTVLGGHAIWAGWLMIAVMIITGAPPVVLGILKMRLAEPLHDKVIYSDADMSKANWQSGLATVLGVLGIGIGWWWADGAAALFVAVGILRDGVRNIRAAVRDLMDVRARTYDDRAPHPLIGQAEDAARDTAWVTSARARARDLGHVLHVELFVEPVDGRVPSLQELAALRDRVRAIDRKLADVVIVPTDELPRPMEEALGDWGRWRDARAETDPSHARLPGWISTSRPGEADASLGVKGRAGSVRSAAGTPADERDHGVGVDAQGGDRTGCDIGSLPASRLFDSLAARHLN